MTGPILLLACIVVEGPRIMGSDVARSGSLRGIPADAVLGFSPAPGVRRVFSVQALQRIAAKYGLAPPAQAELCFERDAAPLAPARLEKAMRSALNEPEAEIDITDFSRFPAPRGDIVFPRTSLRSVPGQPSRDVLWRGYVVYDESKRFPVWARVRVTVPVTRIVAASAIAAGEVIEPARLRVRIVREFPTAQGAPDMAAVIGKRARRSIPAGAQVEERFLEREPDIRKGATVQVRVTRGAATLGLTATALTDAQAGEFLRLKNQQSGKTFRGRAEARDLVVVEE